MIDMPTEAMISNFTDNDLTHINDDHFQINLVAQLLGEIYVVSSPIPPPRYDDTPQCSTTFAHSSYDTSTASAHNMPFNIS